jgi:hypothetical protein
MKAAGALEPAEGVGESERDLKRDAGRSTETRSLLNYVAADFGDLTPEDARIKEISQGNDSQDAHILR